MRLALFVILATISVGCNNTNNTANENGKNTYRKLVETKDSLNYFFEKAKVVTLPFVDSTNFDNFIETNLLSDAEVGLLKLKMLNDNATNFFIRYRVPFSLGFKSIVVTYKGSEEEQFTTLINYNNEWNIIDKIDIAYDEVAESAFRKISTIDTTTLKIDEIDLTGEKPSHTIITYKILNNGHFKIKK